jgi:hypothetical protein
MAFPLDAVRIFRLEAQTIRRRLPQKKKSIEPHAPLDGFQWCTMVVQRGSVEETATV